ncbi:MAG TPA: right-handed parallel beta-helix repeat-containing protein [Polyangiaceae bacterium]
MRTCAAVLALALLGASLLRCGGNGSTSSSGDGGAADGSLSADASDAPSGSSSGGDDGASSSSSGGSIEAGSGSGSGGSSGGGHDAGSTLDAGDAGDGAVPIDPDAFYVATNGNDANPGTLAQPFATLAKAQTAMRASAKSKTTYVRAGTYQPPKSGATCMYGNAAGSSIELLAADAGETWSFYPPDGYGSAILDGQSTTGNSGGTGGDGVGCAFAASGASNVRVIGLQFERYLYAAFWGYQSPGVALSDNVIHDTTAAAFGAGGIIVIDSPGATIAHNALHDLAYMGIVVSDSSTTGDQMSTSLVSGNVVLNACTWPAVSGGGNDENGGDCGGIYFWSHVASVSTNLRIEDNLVRDVNVSSAGAGDFSSCCAQGIYLDFGTSNVSITGNVVTGVLSACFQINGGIDNVITGNLCDLGAAAGTQIVAYQNHNVTPMTGNVFQGNVVVAGSAAGGGGFVGNTPPNPMTVAHNAYFDYAGSTVNSAATGGAGADSSPVYVDPQVSCWAPIMAAGSPVRSAPVSFPGVVGGWGPPGYVLPMTGTAPSWPHGC